MNDAFAALMDHFIKDSERLLEAFKLLKKKHRYSEQNFQLMDI
jgi:hypothetical protein